MLLQFQTVEATMFITGTMLSSFSVCRQFLPSVGCRSSSEGTCNVLRVFVQLRDAAVRAIFLLRLLLQLSLFS